MAKTKPYVCADDTLYQPDCEDCIVSCDDFYEYQRQVQVALDEKQDVLTAGANIRITQEDDVPVISTTGVYNTTQVDALLENKANTDNVYTKDETYNKQEVDSLVDAIVGATMEIVQELPATGSGSTIYLVPMQSPHPSVPPHMKTHI